MKRIKELNKEYNDIKKKYQLYYAMINDIKGLLYLTHLDIKYDIRYSGVIQGKRLKEFRTKLKFYENEIHRIKREIKKYQRNNEKHLVVSK